MTADPMTLQEAADRLGVHYMTAYRYVRTGRLAATRDGGQWRVGERAIRDFTDGPQPGRGRATELTRLVDRGVDRHELGAWSIVEAALASGRTASTIEREIVIPALAEIGRQWADGTLTVADEHVASGVTMRLLGRMSPLFRPRGRRRGTILLGAPAGEQHSLPSMILADQLRGRSFEVLALGADTPTASFLDRAQRINDLHAVGISVTRADLDDTVVELTTTLHQHLTCPVFVGGSGVRDDDHARALGSDGYGTSLDDAVAILVGPDTT